MADTPPTPGADAILAEENEPWVLPSQRKVGMICLIVTECALFTIFLVAYLFYIGASLSGPLPGDVLEIPWIATICLLSSSLTVYWAEVAFKKGNDSGFRLWWGITILLGLIFIGYTAWEWYHLIFTHNLYISTNLFGSTYYSLVGLHATHVLVGLTILSIVLVLSVFGLIPRDQSERIEMISWYWHFVDGIWVVVFTVVYLLSTGFLEAFLS